MKKKLFIIVALISLLSLGCGSNNDENKRRYELVCSPFTVNNNTFVGMRVLDTYTGDVWGYTFARKDADSSWTYLGNPTKLNSRK